MHYDRMLRLVSKALDYGASRVTMSGYEWDLSRDCLSPVTRQLHSRPSAKETSLERRVIIEAKRLFPGAKVVKGLDERPTREKNIIVRTSPYIDPAKRTKIPLTLTMELPCRRCDRCLRRRQMFWALRAKSETEAAPRTWFGTLTFTPEAHSRHGNLCRVRLAKQGVDFDALSFGEQFTERVKEAGREVTLYLKRVRKESGVKFRYLCVAEYHPGGGDHHGLPHYHVLLHESSLDQPIRHKTLSSQWLAGFEKWRLVAQVSEATYLCKYLGKTTAARVRASGGYGIEGLGHSPTDVKTDYSPKARH